MQKEVNTYRKLSHSTYIFQQASQDLREEGSRASDYLSAFCTKDDDDDGADGADEGDIMMVIG